MYQSGNLSEEMAQARKLQPLVLCCRVSTFLCALPLEHVAETMRPLAIQPILGAPSFVQGVAIIRGDPVPVVDTGNLMGAEAARRTRFVTVKAGERRVALAVDSVLNVTRIPAESLQDLPPLLRAADSEAISKIGALDAELLLVLQGARLVPEDVWTQIGARGSR